MLGFVARWISDAVSLALALALAIVAMQLPALTNNYTAALLQVTNDIRRDIDQREQSARAYYHLAAETDEQVVAALRTPEPSNAQSLEQSLGRFRVLRAAYNRIEAAPPLLEPPTALLDAAADQHGYKLAILRTAIETHVTQIAFSQAAAIYGLIGLALGSLLAQLLGSLAMLGRRRNQRRLV